MNPILLLCIIMTVILMTMPLVILFIGTIKKQFPILKVGLIWVLVNLMLTIGVWVLYALKLSKM